MPLSCAGKCTFVKKIKRSRQKDQDKKIKTVYLISSNLIDYKTIPYAKKARWKEVGDSDYLKYEPNRFSHKEI